MILAFHNGNAPKMMRAYWVPDECVQYETKFNLYGFVLIQSLGRKKIN